jgi:hypothetical protein
MRLCILYSVGVASVETSADMRGFRDEAAVGPVRAARPWGAEEVLAL